MWSPVQVIFVVLVPTCVLFMSSRLVVGQGLQQNNENGNFTCTTTGRFPRPENCSKYYLCQLLSSGDLYLSEMTCPNALVFNPNSQKCTTTDKYSCTATTTTTSTTTTPTTTTEPPNLCVAPGFICNTITTYTLCADLNVPIVTDRPCPQGYYCNEKCVVPCLNSVPAC